MKTKLSPEAAHAKYEYNKKYQDRYWERKAAQQKQQEPDGNVSVSRHTRNEAQYINALETSNMVLNKENRRLVKMISNYQTIISQSAMAAL
jgi:hypothetical protein